MPEKKPASQPGKNRKKRYETAHLLSPEQSMKITGFGRSLTYRLLREGYLPSVRIRTHWYIPRTALQRYLDKIG